MSRTWKIIIGGVAAVVIVVAGLVWWAVSQGWTPGLYVRQARQAVQVEVRLVDDDEDGVPDRGIIDLPFRPGFGPGRGGRFAEESEAERAQLGVRLIDDDGDGIPDRGVIERPDRGDFGRGFGPPRGGRFGPRFGHNFGPGRGGYFGWPFGPFFLIGGLFKLVFWVVVIGLIIFFIRNWRSSPPATPASTQPGD